MPVGLTELDARLADALPPGSLFAVGGRVRDEIRSEIEGTSVEAKDPDYVVVGLDADELRARLARLGRVDHVGASFAVFKLVLDGYVADLALPRRERSSGIGHRDFEIESGPEVSLEDDLARRDFRMNMIARAIPRGEIVDPYGGRADIEARRIDLLREAAFEEDPLRMLRGCQFAARFRYALTDRTAAAMDCAAPLVATVSPERVAGELAKLLQAERPSVGIELMREHGLLAYLWPELLEGVGVEQNEWHAYDVYRHNLATLDATPPGDPVLRLAALLHDVGKPRVKDGPHFYRHEHVGEEMSRSMLDRIRCPREVSETVAHLVRQHMFTADPDMSAASLRRFIRRVGSEHLDRLFALRRADVVGSGLPKRDDSNERFAERVSEILAERPAFSVKDLRITGDDVIEAMVARGLARPGFRGDRRVGEILKQLFEMVTEDPTLNERPALEAQLARLLDGTGSPKTTAERPRR